MNNYLESFACGENVLFFTDLSLALDLDVYSLLFPKDTIRFRGYSDRKVKVPDYPLSHNAGIKFSKSVYFFFKVDEDREDIQTILSHLELFQTKNKNEIIGTLLAEKNMLPALPPLFEKKKKQKKKKPAAKKEKAKEEVVVVANPTSAGETETDPVIIQSNFYNGLFIDEYWLKTCGCIQHMCGRCDPTKKEVQPCYDCSVYIFLTVRLDTFFKGTNMDYREVAVEHPAFFQRMFYSLFRYRTRSPRYQIVVAYSVLELIMELIANPAQKTIGHSEVWYTKAHKDRVEAHRDILNYEKFHPLQLKVTDSMLTRFQKLEEHVFEKFKLFVQKSQHLESRYIASEPYSQYRDRNFANPPAPFNNKLSEVEFTKRLGVEGSLKVVPVASSSSSSLQEKNTTQD